MRCSTVVKAEGIARAAAILIVDVVAMVVLVIVMLRHFKLAPGGEAGPGPGAGVILVLPLLPPPTVLFALILALLQLQGPRSLPSVTNLRAVVAS